MRFNVVDSSGWIEYFLDTDRADFFAPAILNTQQLIVPTISIYEVHKRLSQLCPAALVDECIAMMQKARVIDLTYERAIAASRIAATHQLAMADAVIYAVTLEFDALLLTQDIDYQGLANIAFNPKNTA